MTRLSSRALSRRAVVGSIAILCASLWPTESHSSGLSPPWVGQVWSGPTTADAAALYWNPAMLSKVKKFRIEGNTELVAPYITYTRERRGVYQREDGLKFSLPLEEADLARNKTGVAQPVGPENTIIPAGSLFAALPVHDRVTLGLGLFGLAGAIIKFPDTGPARWQLQEASLLGLAITAGAGFRVTDKFRLGASVYYVGGRMGLRKVADLAATDLLGKALANPPINQPNDFGQSAPTGVRELSVLSRPFTLKDAAAHAATFSMGFAFEPTKTLTLGLTYIHRIPLKLKGRFFLDMNDDFFTQDLSSQGLKYPPIVQGDAYVEFPLPSTIKMGVGWDLHDSFRLQFLFEYFHYSDIDSFLITLQSPDLAQPTLRVSDVVKLKEERRWRNTFTAALTGIYHLNAYVDFGLTAGFQSSASPDETIDLSSPDGDRMVFAIGSRLNAGRFELTAALHWHHFMTRHVVTSDFDRANGTYKMDFLLFTGSLAVSF
jgi:long-chain fatty acid transport protein